ncbi:MAG TPA: hypothetical protein PKY82_32200 [Pyrinomonadaceae bacterium]|nr:hypothetical protein [Pyrinomonadaceae bacterium]
MSENLAIKNSAQSPTTIRILGGLLIFIGTILVGAMAAIMMWINNAINNPASTNKFNGTPEQQKITFLILGAVMVFGITAMIGGFWQLLTGKRNKTLIFVMLGLWVVLMILAWFVQKFF